MAGTGTRRLENAHRIALETEDVGADILRNLHGQRSQLEHTRDTVSIPLRGVDLMPRIGPDAFEVVGTGGSEYRPSVGDAEANDLEVSSIALTSHHGGGLMSMV